MLYSTPSSKTIQRLPDVFEYFQHVTQDTPHCHEGGGHAASEIEKGVTDGAAAASGSCARIREEGMRAVLVCSYQVAPGFKVNINIRNCQLKDENEEDEDDVLLALEMTICSFASSSSSSSSSSIPMVPSAPSPGTVTSGSVVSAAQTFSMKLKRGEADNFGEMSLNKDEERFWVSLFTILWCEVY